MSNYQCHISITVHIHYLFYITGLPDPVLLWTKNTDNYCQHTTYTKVQII